MQYKNIIQNKVNFLSYSSIKPASYPMGTISSFLGGEAAGVWSWPLTTI